ncbi:MAG: DUF58 domain-containing protein [Planctomycetota bacterium]
MKATWELTARGRTLAMLACLATCGAVAAGGPDAALAAALLLAPLLVDVLWRQGRLPLAIELHDRRTVAGSPFVERLYLHNESRHRTLRDLRIAEPRTAGRSRAVFVERLAPGQRAIVPLPARMRRRGRLLQRVIFVETCYPLGLVRNRAAVPCRAELIVEPARAAVPLTALPAAAEMAAATAFTRSRGDGEFYALREYRVGDDAREVHALRSATQATLVRQVRRGADERDFCIVLDLRRPPGPVDATGGRYFEWALGVAARLIDTLPNGDAAVSFLLLEQPPRLCAPLTAAGATELLLHLATARPAPPLPLPDTVLDRLRQHASCLWIAAGGHPAHDERAALQRVVLLGQGAAS